ncbi:MAG TPA: hypothetical protein VIV60_27305 [Polyangiaceae bacterium]
MKQPDVTLFALDKTRLEYEVVPDVQIPTDYEAIDRLLDAGDIEQAREILGSTDAADESYTVLRIKLTLFDGSLPPAAAMQKLIALMRRQKDWPFAKDVYQIASQRAYAEHESSVSHSHIPPPVKRES